MQEISPYLDFVIDEFSKMGYFTFVQKVSYELQPGANKMLVIEHQ